jgi:hypothetical protein
MENPTQEIWKEWRKRIKEVNNWQNMGLSKIKATLKILHPRCERKALALPFTKQKANGKSV